MRTIKKAFFIIIRLSLLFFASCGGIERKHAISYSDVYLKSNITNLRDLTQGFEERIKKYLNTDNVYVIVHPSYYIFFFEKPFYVVPEQSGNVVESFLEMDFMSDNPVVSLMQEYERTEMEFISSALRDKKVVILLLPGGYINSKHYVYRKKPAEFARYLNDTVQRPGSVFYMESRSVNSGRTDKEEMDVLYNFLKRIRAKKIYIGGGYVGRCQEEFYKALSRVWPKNEIAIIPELSAFSPDDISESTAKMLLTPDMKLNSWAVNYFIKNGGVKSLNTKISIKNISELEDGSPLK